MTNLCAKPFSDLFHWCWNWRSQYPSPHSLWPSLKRVRLGGWSHLMVPLLTLPNDWTNACLTQDKFWWAFTFDWLCFSVCSCCPLLHRPTLWIHLYTEKVQCCKLSSRVFNFLSILKLASLFLESIPKVTVEGSSLCCIQSKALDFLEDSEFWIYTYKSYI